MPQLLYNAAECSLTESDSYCSEELDMLVSSLDQVQARIPGSTVVLNAINRLRASRNSGRVRNTTTMCESRENVYDIFSFRDLFPFLNSLSPRLALWEVYAGGHIPRPGDPYDRHRRPLLDLWGVRGSFSTCVCRSTTAIFLNIRLPLLSTSYGLIMNYLTLK
ncbi:hypothetical protein BDV38DRAFT_279126 [Aspergillus pseudotamarii]|uniref:Uncharacterized protein n=1 Tax=Aspergillus pseudotamarii TaxID=132259 RepID=A0A5N6T4I8_ASPPS|nr:uncharacterized protein BDV38DRAFT_279126 [Aspergillus pseudotamarii]KAE8141218.1 hypothetical protein BDV38DRAFT_279126 [Aspergillus pseudotamarii]